MRTTLIHVLLDSSKIENSCCLNILRKEHRDKALFEHWSSSEIEPCANHSNIRQVLPEFLYNVEIRYSTEFYHKLKTNFYIRITLYSSQLLCI